MPTQIQLRRGTTSEHSSFTGAAGEVTVDTTKKALVVHDGSTAGGIPVARDSTVVHTSGAETVAGVKTLSSNPVLDAGTANGVAYLNGSKALTSGSGLVFDGSNLGLGVTPSAWEPTMRAFQVANVGAHIAAGMNNFSGSQQLFIGNNSHFNSSGQHIYARTNTAALYRQLDNSHLWLVAPSGTAGNAISFTQAMTLDASGLLTVGNTSPAGSSQITAYGASNGQIAVQNSTNWSRLLQNAGDLYIDNGVGGSAGNIIFRSSSSTAERARIDSSGNLLVGTQSALISTDYRLSVSGTRGAEFKSTGGATAPTNTIWNNATTGDNIFESFRTETSDTQRGTISYNRTGGLVAYNTTSDYRAKDIIGPVANPGAIIDALKVYEGKMKGATQSRPMLVAHEAQAVAPYAVTGEKDAVNEDGTPKFQQMDVSSLVPLLLAELQSLRARVAQLEQGA